MKAVSLLTSYLLRGLVFALVLLIVWPALAGDPGPRSYPSAEIFVNNHKFGESNGCSSAATEIGRMTCGHPGHVSEVSWKFLRSTREGDVYEFTRRYSSDAENPEVATKEATYAGKLLTLWHDDYQNIILRPTPAAR